MAILPATGTATTERAQDQQAQMLTQEILLAIGLQLIRVSIPLNTDNGTTAAGAASSALSEMDIIQP